MKPETEYSTCLENAVFLQLRKQSYENIFYYKTSSGKEIDFITQEVNGKIAIYQVCIDLQSDKTKQREITALVEAAKELQLDYAQIITIDTNETLALDNLTIQIIPYWQWASATH